MGAHMAGFTEDGDGAVEGKRDRLRFVQLFAIWCAWPRTQCIWYRACARLCLCCLCSKCCCVSVDLSVPRSAY